MRLDNELSEAAYLSSAMIPIFCSCIYSVSRTLPQSNPFLDTWLVGYYQNLSRLTLHRYFTEYSLASKKTVTQLLAANVTVLALVYMFYSIMSRH